MASSALAFTKREIEVLTHVIQGKSSREVADALFVSKRTVDFHLANVYDKLHVSNRVQAFLAAGHVCSVMGYWQYPPLVEKYRVPIVITGFEPLDVLEGIRRTIAQLESGQSEVENAYERPGGHAAGIARYLDNRKVS